MSNSFKHYPISKMKNDKDMKRLATHRARYTTVTEEENNLPSGGAYKKLMNAWDICDWKFKSQTPDEFVKNNFNYAKAEHKDWSDEQITKHLKYTWNKWYKNK